jgi:hypothetical protein
LQGLRDWRFLGGSGGRHFRKSRKTLEGFSRQARQSRAFLETFARGTIEGRLVESRVKRDDLSTDPEGFPQHPSTGTSLCTKVSQPAMYPFEVRAGPLSLFVLHFIAIIFGNGSVAAANKVARGAEGNLQTSRTDAKCDLR